MQTEKSYRWTVLIASCLGPFVFGLSMQVLPPVLPMLIRDFGLTHAEAGLSMGLFAAPMIFLSIPAGMLADRHGPRLVGLIAFAVTIAGDLLVASSPTFPVLLAGRAFTGLGAITLVLISSQFVSQWFHGKELGLAVGIWNTAFPLAAILSLTTMGSIGQAMGGWRGPVLIAAAVALASMVAFGLLASPAPLAQEHVRPQGSIRSQIFLAGPSIWFVGAAWLFFNASTVAFFSFAPDYFQSAGYSVTDAGLLSSMTLWGVFLLAPLVGLLLDRGMRPKLLIVLGSVGYALSLAVLPVNPSWAVPILLFVTLANQLTVVSIFALPPSLLTPNLLGLGYGILATCMNIGTTLGPLAVGLARDLTGAYTVSFWVMAFLALLISVSVAPMFISHKNAAVAPTATRE